MNLGKGGNRVSSKEIINIASLATNYNDDYKNNNCLTVDEDKRSNFEFSENYFDTLNEKKSWTTQQQINLALLRKKC